MSHAKEMFMQQRDSDLQEFDLSKTKKLLSLNKSDINKQVENSYNDVVNGYTDPLEALVFAKKGEALFKALSDKVRPLAEEKDYGKNHSIYSTEVKANTTGSGWDYTPCNDALYNDLLLEQTELKNKIKDREAFLQSIKTPLDTFDKDTGETFTINPPIRIHGKVGISLTIK